MVAVRETARRTWVVAARELSERSRSLAFRASTVLGVLAMAALVVVPSLGDDGPRTYRVGLAGTVSSGTVAALDAQARAAGVRVRTTTFGSVAAGEHAVRDKTVQVLLVDGDRLAWRLRADASLGVLVAGAVQAVQVQQRAAQRGLDPADVAALLAPVALTDDVLGSAPGVENAARDVGFYAVVLLFVAVSVYGQMVLTGVVQEKQSRVAEVLLSRMRPQELLAGKVLGIGLLGLAQFAVLVATAGVALATVDDVDAPEVAVSLWVWLVVWFVLGYALYSVVYAAFGALASRVEDASSAAAPISVVMIGGYVAAMSTLESPDSTLAAVLSFLPATAPMAMPLRMTLMNVPLWQVLLSAGLTAATVWATVLLASRVYRGAVLRTGTRLRVLAAWRAGRHAGGLS